MGAIEELVDEHVATIRHDLKSPLSVIAIDAKVLEEHHSDKIPAGIRSALRRIAANVAFMDRMVRELIDLSGIEAGRLRLHREPIDLARLLPKVIDRCVAPSNRASVCLDAPMHARVMIDTSRIERVVANLLDNAFAYAPMSPVVVRLVSAQAHARVSVSDLGPGLGPAQLEALLVKHHRAPSSSYREGAGLGLYVSRRIVEAHGGRLTVTSRVGRGSTFTFELPLYNE
jgi:two-component system, OmpR family, phosphate regulon sensor histidine kinase PhoR